jgi:osmotically-inducible protein OsmY
MAIRSPSSPGGDVDVSMKADGVSDVAVVRVVLRELGADPVVGREHVEVTVDQGVVTLRGSLHDRLAKARAVAIPSVVRGVRGVLDRLSVATPARPDEELTFAAAAVLGRDPALAGQAIGAVTRDAIVHLSGDVDSDAPRRAAERDVLGMAGVRDVVDDLAVRPGHRTDLVLLAQVKRMLLDDLWLGAPRLRVTTRRGVVRIEGFVHSATEKARIESDARLTSPRDVDTSALQYEAATGDGTLRGDAVTERPDSAITAAIAHLYGLDPRLRGFQPHVDVRNGVVALTGVVPGRDAATVAEEDARNVVGVEAVHNDLRVGDGEPAVPATDREVRLQATDAIDHDPNLSRALLGVDVMGGRVILNGVVGTEAERLGAIEDASSVPGAGQIEDNLRVRPRPLFLSDAELGADVRDSLELSQEIGVDGLRVTAQQGVVTLEGAVGSSGERQSATDAAYRAGARRVVNRLSVAPEGGP